MIDELAAWLGTDATLLALLGGDANNTKLYDVGRRIEGEPTPLIRFGYASDGTAEDVLDHAVVRLEVFCEDLARSSGIAVVQRLIELLDAYEGIKNKVSGANYVLLYSKMVGGIDRFEEDARMHHMVRFFHVKFKRVTGG